MAMIKSALELALERTKNLKVDENAIHMNEIKMDGKKTAGKYLEDPASVDLAQTIKDLPTDEREIFRRAVFDVFAGLIQLPSSAYDEGKMSAIGGGLGVVARCAPTAGGGMAGPAMEKKVTALVQQITAFFTKYLEEVKRIDQAIRNQWAPRFKEQERQMALQTGRQVRVDPMTDPQFVEFYKKNVESLQHSYGDALEKARRELTAMCGFSADQDDVK